MDELFLFYKNSLLKNLCSEYSNEWNALKYNKRKLFDLSLRQQSLPYMATSTFNGWGLSVDYICNNFMDFINGKYIGVDCDGVHGYTYERYCKYDNTFTIHSDVVDIMKCNCSINIEKTKCPTLYINNSSCVSIDCEGFSSIRIYLFDNSVVKLNNIDEDSCVLIYKYSKDCKVEKTFNCFGSIREFNKEIRL